MPWLQITLASTPDEAPLVSDLLTEAGAVAVTFVDAGDEPKYQPVTEATDFWSHTHVTGLFPAQANASSILDFLKGQLGRLPMHQTATLQDQNWEQVCWDQCQAMSFGSGLWVCPSWQTPPDPDAANIIIDPGLAFGTGSHASTALCLEWLEQHPPIDQAIMDFGCGSGILAIAALKLGGRQAWACDLDPQALAVTRDNAIKNDVGDRLQTLAPDALTPGLKVDTVLANILAKPLMTLAPTLTALVKPSGNLILAGLLDQQIPAVRACYEPAFSFTVHRKQDWVLLAGHTRRDN